MAKPVRITLIIIGSLVLLMVILGLVSTIGLNEIKKYKIPEIDLSSIADGEYQGSCSISRWTNALRVTVKDHKIVRVDVVKKMMSNAPDDFVAEVFKRIIEKQSLDIDAVSGATATTKGFQIAVADALNKAKK
jgi:uncharacterized protein with FMN-binding domain